MDPIKLDKEDLREGLRLLRTEKLAHDQMHVAENEYKIWASQMMAMYDVPDGYVLRDLIVGFEPVAEVQNGS